MSRVLGMRMSTVLAGIASVVLFAGFGLPVLQAAPAAAADAPLCGNLAPTIVGTPGDDTINGTPGQDVIDGLGGNDVINGGGGADVICGGEGNDIINGGDGSDF